MDSRFAHLLSGVCLLGLFATPSLTQEQEQSKSSNRIAAIADWGAFAGGDPLECWVVSVPRETVNMRDGRIVAVRRGDIFMQVMYRPSEDVFGQVAFTSGYPFAPGSTVNLNVDGTEFELSWTIPDDDSSTAWDEREWAWPMSEAEDSEIITAMKLGRQAVVTAQSSRGTTTRDTFSLIGFTAALEEAAQHCAAN